MRAFPAVHTPTLQPVSHRQGGESRSCHFAAGGGGRLRLTARLTLVAFALLGAVLAVTPALAQPSVPAPLQPWVPWVLEEVGARACPLRDGAHLCGWPGELRLQLSAKGGEFRQTLQADRAMHMPLPGGTGSYPERVTVDGKPVPVATQGGQPMVWLSAGAHTVTGRFVWSSLPERLPVPNETGLVALTVDRKPLPFARRDEDGQLWLRAKQSQQSEGDSLSLSVFRRIEDGIPMRLVTFLRLRVSGRAREVNLGQALLDKSVPIGVESKLPARLEASGELRMQVRAGTHEVYLEARFEGDQEAITLGPRKAPFPDREVWVWKANETLRQVELSGAPAVDPARTELPARWKGLPTFALKAGGTLALQTERRGEPTPPPSQLEVQRQMWLDLDGDGFTVRDTIDATLASAARLDLLEGTLGHVAQRRPAREDLLITQAPRGVAGQPDAAGEPDEPSAEPIAGVELRRQSQQLVAEWRHTGSASSLPAVAWSQDVQRLSTELHLGPGYRLLAASGVDDVDRTWLTDWDLFDLFFVLLISIAVARMWGPPVGAVALLTLVLCHQEPDAPQLSWLVLIILTAVLRVLPAGRVRRVVNGLRWLTALTLILVAVPFAVEQARTALFVQLDRGAHGASPSSFDFTLSKESAPARGPMPATEMAEEEAQWLEDSVMEDSIEIEGDAVQGAPSPQDASQAAPASAPMPAGTLEPSSVGGSRPMPKKARKVGGDAWRANQAMKQDPEAVVQTGPGVPTWQWQTRRLSWTGPVESDHRVSLWLLTPPWTRLLSVVRIALVACLIFFLLRRGGLGRSGPSASSQGRQGKVRQGKVRQGKATRRLGLRRRRPPMRGCRLGPVSGCCSPPFRVCNPG